jgi:heme A synthase
MSVESVPDRPVPRWLHVGAVVAVGISLFPLVLGMIVTSVRAGMADPKWPTEPWYLLNNFQLKFGYLIEHSHRIAGFVLGIVFSLLTLGFWRTEPRTVARWAGLAALVVMLAAYGQLHKVVDNQSQGQRTVWPVPVLAVIGAAFLAAVGLAVSGRGVRGSGLRLLAVVALAGVMFQGVLGGLRVRENPIGGDRLAPVHGVFGQVVFCLLVALAVLTARPAAGEVPAPARRVLGRVSVLLVGLLFVQLVWGALVRHFPDPLNQRLHLLTAFLVVAAAVWLLRVGFTTATRPRVAVAGWVLGALLVTQVTLGVEAWMTKFGEEARRGKPASSFLPEAEAVTEKQAVLRTTHTLIGTGVLAAAVVIALRVRQRPGSKADNGTGVGFARQAAPRPGLVGAGQTGETT